MNKQLFLAVAILSTASLGHATNMTLGLAQGYNVFTFSDFTPTGSDTLGKVAVGGNFSGSGYLVGSALHSSATTLDFIVKGNLTDSNFTGTGGGIYVGGNATLYGASVGNLYVGGTLSTNNGSLTTAAVAANGGINAGSGGLSNSGNLYTQGSFTAGYASNSVYYGTSYNGPGYVNHALYSTATNPLTVPTTPIDFTTAQTNLGTATNGLSNLLANTASNGTTVITSNNGVKLTGNNATQNVFNLTAAQLTAALTGGTDGLTINAPAGSVVIVNVVGSSVAISGSSIALTGVSASNVLFNFSSATAISLNNFGFIGSVLAPGATFTGLGGQFNGTLIANAVTGVTEFHNDYLFSGSVNVNSVSAAPEPSTWMMALTAIVFCGFIVRKRVNTPRN